MKCKASLASRSPASAGFFVYVFGMRSIRGGAFKEDAAALRKLSSSAISPGFVTLNSIYIDRGTDVLSLLVAAMVKRSRQR